MHSKVQLLNTLLEEFHSNIAKSQNNVLRNKQFPDVDNKIKVAIGMRRSGKTTFMYQHINAILKQGIQLSQILFINFEDDRLLPLNQTDLAELLDAFYTIYPENHHRQTYLFLDEIQNVDDWPLVIRRFFDSKQVQLFLTGSSAKLLSKEIASSLRGRSISTEILPFSFHEYLTAKDVALDKKPFGKVAIDTLQHHFLEYMNIGGFPEVINYSQEIRQNVLQEYIQVVILRDIIERHHITNYELIKYLVKMVLHNVASSFSINKIFNDLKSQGFSVSKDTIYDYMAFIEDAYVAFTVKLHSDSLRKSQVNPKKIYAVDTGLVKAHSFSFMHNYGRMFENIVYLDLRRMGYQIEYYLTAERYEVDFLAFDGTHKPCLIQVVWDANDPKTWARENRALEKAMHELKLPGKIITLESYLRDGC